jgi:hypothetical protein
MVRMIASAHFGTHAKPSNMNKSHMRSVVSHRRRCVKRHMNHGVTYMSGSMPHDTK